MRALVTGGADFIGSNIVHEWLAMGHEAVILQPCNTRMTFMTRYIFIK